MILKKDNEISISKSHLKIPNIHLVQIVEVHQVEEEKDKLLAIVEEHRDEEERDININELASQISTLQFQRDRRAQNIEECQSPFLLDCHVQVLPCGWFSLIHHCQIKIWAPLFQLIPFSQDLYHNDSI